MNTEQQIRVGFSNVRADIKKLSHRLQRLETAPSDIVKQVNRLYPRVGIIREIISSNSFIGDLCNANEEAIPSGMYSNLTVICQSSEVGNMAVGNFFAAIIYNNKWRCIGIYSSDVNQSSILKTAYCKEDAPAGTVIKCWLDYNGQPAAAWDEDEFYRLDDYVIYDSVVYYSLQDNNQSHVPDEADSEWWAAADVGKTAEAHNNGVEYSIGCVCTYDGTSWVSLKDDNMIHTPGDVGDPGWWAEITSIDVVCTIANGHRLDQAFPLLLAGQKIKIENCGGTWNAVTLFAGATETCAEGSLLELMSQRQLYDIANTSNTTFKYLSELGGEGLTIASLTNSEYVIEYMILYTAAATTTGIVLKWEAPSGAEVSGILYQGNQTNTLSAFSTPVTFNNSIAGTNLVRCELFVKIGSTAGQIKPMFASEVNGSEVKILIGSTVKWRRSLVSA